ncbi:MAG: alpha-ketoacid dehydrogenase subunit beta [Chloroflexi bacterium]|nr:alpha-ketoacid dehydrogenase subunit beta [Chloroflexota bacterium]
MARVNYVSAMRLALKQALGDDPRTFLMGEDIGHYGGVFRITAGLQDEFGAERVRDTPISEAAFIGAALGAAMCGLRPIVEVMYVDFTLVGMDQIINQTAKTRFMTGGQFQTPMTILTQGGGGKGNAAQHSQSLEAVFAQIPGLTVALPGTVPDAYHLLLAATRHDDPCIVIAHKALFGDIADLDAASSGDPFGRAVVRRVGSQITLVAWSAMVKQALAAAEALAADGVDAEVIDLRTLRPFDYDTVATSVQKTGRCLVIQEAPLTGGFAGEVAASIGEYAFDHLDAPVVRIGGAEMPLPYAVNLESMAIPDAARIVAAASRLVAA